MVTFDILEPVDFPLPSHKFNLYLGFDSKLYRTRASLWKIFTATFSIAFRKYSFSKTFSWAKYIFNWIQNASILNPDLPLTTLFFEHAPNAKSIHTRTLTQHKKRKKCARMHFDPFGKKTVEKAPRERRIIRKIEKENETLIRGGWQQWPSLSETASNYSFNNSAFGEQTNKRSNKLNWNASRFKCKRWCKHFALSIWNHLNICSTTVGCNAQHFYYILFRFVRIGFHDWSLHNSIK